MWKSKQKNENEVYDHGKWVGVRAIHRNRGRSGLEGVRCVEFEGLEHGQVGIQD